MPSPFQLRNRPWVEARLEFLVQARYPCRPAVHWRKHLNVCHWVEVIACGQATLDKIKDKMLGTHRVFFGEKKEITCRLNLQIRHLPSVDTVRIDNDAALLGLAKQFR